MAPLIAVGAAALLWQVASARSVMAGLYGGELILGLVLACWLLLVGLSTALTAWLLRRGSQSGPRRLLPPTLLLFPVAVLASLLLQRWSLPAFSQAGVVVGPGRALGGTLLCLLPPCALLGGAFGLLALNAPVGAAPAPWAARIYLWESLGTGLAGLAFHLGLAQLPLPLIGVAAGAVPWLAGALLAWRLRPRAGALLCGGAGAAALLFLLPAPWLPGRALLQPSPPGYALREARNSRHSALAVLTRGDQVVFTANGVPVFSSQDRPRVLGPVHTTLLAHARPATVLLIGGGLGEGLGEVLRHPVRRVDYVELDPELVALTHRWGTRQQRAALADERVRVLAGDGRQVVAAARERYDLIMVGLPGPDSALVNRFYTEQFFRDARRALRPGGLLGSTLAGSETYLGDEQALLHATVRAMLARALPAVAVLPGQTTLLLAGRDGAPDLDERTLGPRLTRRGLAAADFGQAELADRLEPMRRELYRERLAGVVPLENTDLRPAAYFQASLHWLAVSSPAAARALDRLGRWAAARGWLAPLAALAGALLLSLLLRRRGRRRGAAGVAIALAGFGGMAVELSLILLCQEQRGVVYHEVGALLTAFMVGMAAGAPAGAWLQRRWPRRALGIGLGAGAAAALLAAGLMGLGSSGAPLPLIAFLLVLACSGLGTGACYAPATAAMANPFSSPGASGQAAAYSYAWDLGGAAAGALLAAAFILPLLGLPTTCLLCAALCAGYSLPLWTNL